MSKGLQRSRVTSSGQVIQNIIIPIKNLAIPVAVGAAGFGSSVIQGLPKGNILILEAFAQMSFSSVSLTTGVANANVTTTFGSTFAIGTTAAVDNLLGTTAANIVPIVTPSAAVGGVSPVAQSTPTALNLIVNNSDSVSGTGTKLIQAPPTIAAPNGSTSVSIKTGPAIKLNLNLTVNAVTTATSTLYANGQVVIAYVVAGNY